MIRRDHISDGVTSQALYSACGSYRHALHRRWGPGPVLGWVMLNPSTATEAQDDPTIARCTARARAMGCGGLAIGNLFALRATDPRQLRRVADPCGAGADAALLAAMAGVGLLICGWGNHGHLQGRDLAVTTALRKAGHQLHHLGLTRSGAPRHPLYLGYAVLPQPWPAG